MLNQAELCEWLHEEIKREQAERLAHREAPTARGVGGRLAAEREDPAEGDQSPR